MDRFQNTRQPDWDWWGELWSNPKQILKTLGISTNQSVADIGSGNGYFTLPLGEIVQPAPVELSVECRQSAHFPSRLEGDMTTATFSRCWFLCSFEYVIGVSHLRFGNVRL